jgi:pimeloyl-ACP methyl ester carboxylesterase
VTGAREQVFQAGDLRVVYREAGTGPPLVLLHGGLDDARGWRRQFEGLAEGLRVLAWDAPGCGGSSPVPEHWRLGDWAEALATWLDGTGVERPHLLGLSWGSSIALAFHDRYPDVAASLILAGAYAGWAGSLPAAEVAARREAALAAAGADPSGGAVGAGGAGGAGAGPVWPGVLSERASPEVVAELSEVWQENAARTTPASFRAMIQSMAEADLRPALGRIRVPTLLIYGELDVRSPLAVARALHAAIPGSELVTIPGAGHLVSAEAAEAFNREVRRFVGRAEARP